MRTQVFLVTALVALFASIVHAENVCLAPPPGFADIQVEYCGTALDPFVNWAGFATSMAEMCSVGDDVCPPAEWFPGYGGVGLALSRSDVDPLDRVGPLNSGSNDIYLWLLCTPVGVGIQNLHLAFDGDAQVASYTPLLGTTNTGTLPEIDVTIPCWEGGWLAFGRLEVTGSATSTSEWDSATWGRVKGAYSVFGD